MGCLICELPGPCRLFPFINSFSENDQEMENMMRCQLIKTDKNEGNILSLPSRRAWVIGPWPRRTPRSLLLLRPYNSNPGDGAVFPFRRKVGAVFRPPTPTKESGSCVPPWGEWELCPLYEESGSCVPSMRKVGAVSPHEERRSCVPPWGKWELCPSVRKSGYQVLSWLPWRQVWPFVRCVTGAGRIIHN